VEREAGEPGELGGLSPRLRVMQKENRLPTFSFQGLLFWSESCENCWGHAFFDDYQGC
jgi:hypothetical protein